MGKLKNDLHQIAVLKKLYLLGVWGKRHTDVKNLQKGFPKHERGNIKNAAKELTKKGYLIQKITGYGLHISLNPNMKKEIERLIGII